MNVIIKCVLYQVVEYLVQNFERLADMGNDAEDYPIHFAAASGQYSTRTMVTSCILCNNRTP